MNKILYGKEVSESIESELDDKAKILKEKGVNPKLAIVRVGENPGDMFYEKAACKKAEKLGIGHVNIAFDKDITQDELIKTINELNEDKNIHGILLLRPFPKHMDDDEVRNAVAPKKDIDGITDTSLTGLITGKHKGFVPCTPKACLEILKYYGYSLEGKNVTIIGRSLVIGKPLSLLMTTHNANVTVCHSKTKKEDMIKHCTGADILVLATGKTESFTHDYLGDGQVIIDVGTGVGKNGKMAGDLDINEVYESKINELAITPVPKGVGSVTTAVLMSNLILAAEKKPD
ncbi:MAG: bifunctional 5,10-methylenetetrahydrofolate dehydrogenase/5,10-methenyltetrahydrofolate cyclohydrolase [Peptostreptococcaceae bacterium]|nr:bifunctional 5,10-methylenetetrahydrofolate dehydrogenase/5,10-methenyltetrahydrofolate cyclohydrolase [Peptostreptococcaceae bacterium]